MIKRTIVFLALFFCFSYSVYSAEFMNLELACESSFCVPNRVSQWNLTITNFGELTLKILNFRIIDAVSGEEVIERDFDKRVEIINSLSHTFSMNEKIPFPNNDNGFIANVCLTLEPELDSWGKAGKEREHCYTDINFTTVITSCLVDNDCRTSEICEEKECVRKECGYCQYASDHICKDYECCVNNECEDREACVSNECSQLECAENEYIVNHTCSSTICAQDEGIVDFSCVKLECAFDEIIKNHECIKLNCAENEFVFNKSCKKLNCSGEEFAQNHRCLSLNCAFDEFPENNICNPLKCNFLQKAEENECRINSNFLLYAFLLFMMGFLVVLNLKKHSFIQRKINVKQFMKEENIEKRESIKRERASSDTNGGSESSDGSKRDKS